MTNLDLFGMESMNMTQNVTIVPRLEYSNNLLDSIVNVLQKKRSELQKLNLILLDLNDDACIKALNLERTIAFSLEILFQIKNRLNSISGITSIPELLPLTIPMLRTVSAQLFNLLPTCSQKLCELSVHLGSIVLDSAILSRARFDFSQSNEESSLVLDEVKLIVDSKISKQYPNVDFFKSCNT
ncbi:MAG: hypothetical protein HW410_704 [Nitrosarchaeum sp.]|nr:hypothetical protein [Nitrosarchaeum sp.]